MQRTLPPQFQSQSMMSVLLFLILFLVPIIFLLTKRKKRIPSQNVPPGSLGLPFIGQSLSFLRAMRANTAEEWLQARATKYGPVSKLSLFGKPTIFIFGQAANKFVFTGDDSIINNQQAKSLRMILGDRCLLELSGEDHKRVRDALMSFLKPESLKQYIGKMDQEIRKHIQQHWEGHQRVTVLPLMKTLTFDIICTLLFGLERGPRREKFVKYFDEMIEGMWSIPVNMPFTRYRRGLRASAKVQNMVKELIQEKRIELEHKDASVPPQDLISCLLSIRDKENKEVITEKEIIHNVMIVMVAGYDTSAALITFVLRLLATNPKVYASVLQEQEEIAENNASGDILTWEDLTKMKYTWRVAMETLRLYPPIFGGFRKTLKDFEYGGYIIPKGWQIIWVPSMTHMDSKIFRAPTEFDPSRYENQSTIPPYCYVPFGGGPRMCPGNEFARTETLVTIHHLVTQFKWKLCCKDDFFSRDPMPVPTKGLPIEIVSKKLLCCGHQLCFFKQEQVSTNCFFSFMDVPGCMTCQHVEGSRMLSKPIIC